MDLIARAPAKVNLHLEVLHQREDGYHEIETIFQAVELYDTLHFRRTTGPIHVNCTHPSVPTDRTNLCHRAAKLLRSRIGVSGGLEITLEKNIPVAAGLGGGSADAAATLLAASRLWEVELEDEDLLDLATKLGADVPFFLKGGLQLGRGIGEVLTPLNSSGLGTYLIVTPKVEIATSWVYERLRMGLTHGTPKVNLQTTKALLSRFPERQWPGFNRLGDVVFPAYPQLHRLFLELEETRPRVAMLSGSGPSLFAVYSTLDEAEKARDLLLLRDAFTWIGRSTRQGIELLET